MSHKYISLKPLVPSGHIERPVKWPAVFGNLNPVEVEIGFGTGEYLVKLGQAHPAVNFVGIEQDWERICKTLKKIARTKLSNVRILQLDARVAFQRYFVPNSLRQIHCLFPCPWPKSNQEKHRLFSARFLALLNNRLQLNHRLEIVTDYRPYAEWIIEQSGSTGFSLAQTTITAGYDTKFERKWIAEGQKEFYKLDLLKISHCAILEQKEQPLHIYFVERFNYKRLNLPERVERNAFSILYKESLEDEEKQKALVHLIVCEDNLNQHVWVSIHHTEKGWCISPLEGTHIIPTEGANAALDLVFQSAKDTV